MFSYIVVTSECVGKLEKSNYTVLAKLASWESADG